MVPQVFRRLTCAKQLKQVCNLLKQYTTTIRSNSVRVVLNKHLTKIEIPKIALANKSNSKSFA